MPSIAPVKFPQCKGSPRAEAERQIIVALVEDLLAAGFLLGVNDGEETTLDDCADEAKIFGAMYTTDEDFIITHHPDGWDGWIKLVYGNGGWDVISDFTVSLEDRTPAVFTRANELSERFGG